MTEQPDEHESSPKNSIHVGDEIEWQGRTRPVVKIVSINVMLDGVEDVICLPVDATAAELYLSVYRLLKAPMDDLPAAAITPRKTVAGAS